MYDAMPGGKVIVFAHHISVLDGIQAKMGKAFNAVRIDGSTSMANRKQAMDDFQQQPHVKLAILSVSAAGVSHQFLVVNDAHDAACSTACTPSCRTSCKP